VVTAPFYARASESEVRDHFARISDSLSAPVIAYNIPSNVGYSLAAETVARLIQDGVIIGVKDSSSDLGGFRRTVDLGSTDALYLTGSDELLDVSLLIGANGSVAGLANVAPALFSQALHAHRAADARTVAIAQGEINALAQLYVASEPGAGINSIQIGSIKTALMLLGVIESDQLSVPMRRSGISRRGYVQTVLDQLTTLPPSR